MVDGLSSVLMNPIQGSVSFGELLSLPMATWVFAGERLNALLTAAQGFSVVEGQLAAGSG
jgi:hypothetical protein